MRGTLPLGVLSGGAATRRVCEGACRVGVREAGTHMAFPALRACPVCCISLNISLAWSSTVPSTYVWELELSEETLGVKLCFYFYIYWGDVG